MHVYVWDHTLRHLSRTNWWNLVGMKYLLSLRSVTYWRIGEIHPGVDPGWGNKRSQRGPFFDKLLLQRMCESHHVKYGFLIAWSKDMILKEFYFPHYIWCTLMRMDLVLQKLKCTIKKLIAHFLMVLRCTICGPFCPLVVCWFILWTTYFLNSV